MALQRTVHPPTLRERQLAMAWNQLRSQAEEQMITCGFCGYDYSLKHATHHPGMGIICALCVTKMRFFQIC